MASTNVSIAFDKASLDRLAQLLAASSTATGAHCDGGGDEGDD